MNALVTFRNKGDFGNLTRYFEKLKEITHMTILDKYGRAGVEALKNATPIDSGETASSWYYEIERETSVSKLVFYNSHVNKGVPIAIILQYGHGTGTGGWVEGRDYINPAIQPIFDEIAEEAWKEVKNL